MIDVDSEKLSSNLSGILHRAISCNDRVRICTDHGNAVILGEEDYNGLVATLSLCSTSGMTEKVVEGMNTPLEECIPEEDVKW